MVYTLYSEMAAIVDQERRYRLFIKAITVVGLGRDPWHIETRAQNIRTIDNIFAISLNTFHRLVN